jgi:hypothetical protein
MALMLDACPSFRSEWDRFLLEWSADDEKPLYLALDSLARHLIALLAAGQFDELASAFAVVERWHLEGDEYVREAATVGLLEDLQNPGLHESTTPAEFERFLAPESLKWWAKIERLWTQGELITNDG